jgi:(p)ppGpp synthase/HD superfamily hydrolase
MSKHQPKNAETLTIAEKIVHKYHANQWRRRYPLPYATHCYMVAHRLANWGITEDHPYVMECALTHDVIEDAFEEFAAGSEIYHGLGVRYYDIDIELTFKFDPSKGTHKNAQKNEYLASFDKKSVEALVIKASDRLCNSEDFEPTEADPDVSRQTKYLGSAAPLFIAVGRRRSEIEAAFGVNFYLKMADDIQRVHKSLGVECPALV